MPVLYQCARCGDTHQAMSIATRPEHCKDCKRQNWLEEFQFMFDLGEPVARLTRTFGKASTIEVNLRRWGAPELAARWRRYARPPIAECGQATSKSSTPCRNETRHPSGRCDQHRREVAA